LIIPFARKDDPIILLLEPAHGLLFADSKIGNAMLNLLCTVPVLV
jgi:hypothetical protein